MKVCIGGTFNKLHKGHKSLIKKAFHIAGENGFVFIGITIGKMIENKNYIDSFEKRKKSIENFIKEEKFSSDVLIDSIKDRFGPSINGDFDAIIISPETKKTAIEINDERKKINKKPLKIILIPFVLADDNKPISTTRILKKEINRDGIII